ncbi:uncharacterized protein [Coffea arabica]|uniref:Uncharacterized protein isoform X2 n=1 Tax=Coffea arabica TaxID=13443 RepID=A0ABM4VRN3_COFAR
MDTLMANYKDDEDDRDIGDQPHPPSSTATTTTTTTTTKTTITGGGATEAPSDALPKTEPQPEVEQEVEAEPEIGSGGIREEQPTAMVLEDLSSDEISDDNENPKAEEGNGSRNSPNFTKVSEDTEDEEDYEDEPPPKKQKQLSSLTCPSPENPEKLNLGGITTPAAAAAETPPAAMAKSGSKSSKKSKKKNNNVWTRPTSRKGKKKGKNNGNQNGNNTTNIAESEDKVLITPIPRFPDKNDDSPDAAICLSKVYKAEKVELSEDRLSAGSTKGYRMVRATRGVVEGAWYYEIKVVHLGDTGHTRLGWSTDKGDLQAPVGYDGNSFGYRDIDGSKVHKAVREKYGEDGYKEGDVIGFYINLPEGNLYTPKPPRWIWYKGQKYVSAPDAKDDPPKVVPGSAWYPTRMCPMLNVVKEQGTKIVEAAEMVS